MNRRDDPSLNWLVIKNEEIELEADKLLFRVAQLRGPEYASRWYDALIVAMDSLGDFPGPRSYPQNIAESERRRAEVRMRLYSGPDKKPAPSLACHIVFAVYDPRQGEEEGRVRILAVIGARTQAAGDVLTGGDSESEERR